MKQATTTFIFDCGEVLVNGFYGVEKRISRGLDRHVTNAELQTEELRQLFLGKIAEDEFWETMIARFKWEISVDTLKRLVRQNFTEVPGTLEIVRKLRATGYSLGLLSVHAREWVKDIDERFHHESLFHHISYSWCDKAMKPDKEAFDRVLEGLNKKPGECLFIDDHLPNIEAARKLGFQTHHFRSAETLESCLRQQRIPY